MSVKAKARDFRSLNPLAIRRSAISDGFLPGYRAAIRRALAKQVREAPTIIATYEEITEGVRARWKRELDKAKTPWILRMVNEGHSTADKEFENLRPAKSRRRDIQAKVDFDIEANAPQEVAAFRLLTPDFENIRDYIDSTSVSESTTNANRLEKIFLTAQTQEITPRQIARQIVTQGLASSRHQAERIARTGTIWSYNEGAVTRYQEAGVTVMEWVVTFDDRLCPFCQAMDGAKIQPGNSFWSGKDTMQISIRQGGSTSVRSLGFLTDVKHPPLHPNCRCTVVPVFEDEVILETPIEELSDPLQAAEEFGFRATDIVGVGNFIG